MAVTLQEIARALGGEVHGNQVLAPGPGHSRKDRSLSVRLSDATPDGFVVFSHAGDDWRACRDHVADALNLPRDRWRTQCDPDPVEVKRRLEARQRAERREREAVLRRQRRAREICREGRDPRGEIPEAYLISRGLCLPAEIAGDSLFYHPTCPWETGTAPAMVAPLRDVLTGKIVGAHRTALTPDGRKIDRKMLGTAMNAAVMLDPLRAISGTLHVAEGIETALAGRQNYGLTPIWALGTSGAIAALPVLPNVQTLVIAAENDGGASAKAIEAVGTRWHAAGRTIEIIRPPQGAKDLNDAILRGAAA